MKIGLIGNMNNNNFAIMRYFRDLGADAHLLLYSNDGTGSLAHFRPECDTWHPDQWSPYIHRTTIPNAAVAALDFPISWLLSSRSFLNWMHGRHEQWVPAVSRARIRSTYAGYDLLLASGISPATLARIGRPLHIFYPYACGVEFFKTGEFVVKSAGKSVWVRAINDAVARRQLRGLRAAHHILNADTGTTESVLASAGLRSRRLALPMVYNREALPVQPPSGTLQQVAALIADSRFTVLHHARLMWKNDGAYTADDWRKENKNNDWVLHGFAQLAKARPELCPRLLIVEYGPDVDATKHLAQELGIGDHVWWLPKMERRELMWLLARVSVAAGEFYDIPRTIWGGTGWEALAVGKPLLQGFHFEPGEFSQLFGHEPPPLLPVRSRDDVFMHLLRVADDARQREALGRGAQDWFNTHNGLSLARSWLDVLRQAAPQAAASALERASSNSVAT